MSFLESYLNDRHQRVVLNGVQSNWVRLNAGVPQGFVLGPLLFLVYINYLTDNISSNMKLYAGDSSLFASGVDSTHNQIENDPEIIAAWANQWEMLFNPDITKQAVEVIFSVKNKKPIHPSFLMEYLWQGKILLSIYVFTWTSGCPFLNIYAKT